jgi:3',5'-cyclic AMP phosphodiesterase CpdA
MKTIRFAAISCLALLSPACMTGISRPSGPATVVSGVKGEAPIPMPNKDGTFKFAVFGDFGTASPWQFELGAQMVKLHKTFPFEIVLLAGDNIYGPERPQEYVEKFEKPYKALIDAKVKFYAALGNHDDPNQRFYKLFNMEGKRYYSFKAPKQNVRIFALETTYPTPEQIAWVESELKQSTEDWKIMIFHHPLYSSGGRHGSDLQLRETLEPLLVQYNVSVVFTGHDHFYERIKPQKGIVHFVVGSGGKLATGDLDPRSPLTARGLDTDYAFLVGEVDGDKLVFNTVARAGQIVDSGIISRRQPAPAGKEAVPGTTGPGR